MIVQYAINKDICLGSETPMFNALGKNNQDYWNLYKNQWEEPSISEEPEPLQISNKSLIQNRSLILRTTSDITPKVKEANKRKYTQILAQIFRKQPDRFQEELESSVGMVIQQNEARLFFAEHIRIFNPDLTKDRLLRLYRHIDDTEENRRLMGRALSQFRLQEVPYACLPVNRQILKIYEIIYPSVYIEDLLEPSLSLYEQLIESYFCKQFKTQILQIEDQKIELVHPRNLLNILLYLNEYYQINIEKVFEAYIKKMLRHSHISILQRIIQSKICQICEVNEEIFHKCAQSVAKDLLEESSVNFRQVQLMLTLMEQKNKKFFSNIVSFIEYCTLNNLTFNANTLLSLPERKNDNEFLRNIVLSNSPLALAKVNFSTLFKMVSKIQSGKSQTYFTAEHIEISKTVSEILMKSQCYKEAISILLPISSVIGISFLAKLLLVYAGGMFSNRLVRLETLEPEKMFEIFKEILSFKKSSKLTGDTEPLAINQRQKALQWTEFRALCLSYLDDCPWQLSYILYEDIILAKDLVKESVITVDQFAYFCKHLKITKKQLASVCTIKLNTQNILIPLLGSQERSNESAEINQSYVPCGKQKKLLVNQSLKGIQANNEANGKLCQSMLFKQDLTEPTLVTLKIEVERQSILKMLKEIYEESPRDKFLKAVSVIDRQRVGIKHIETYKLLLQKQINYPFERLIPFEYFSSQNDEAWLKAKKIMKSELTIETFWVVYLIIKIVYDQESLVVIALIERIIYYDIDDQWADAIGQILINSNIPQMSLINLSRAAEERGLIRLKEVLAPQKKVQA